MSFSTTTLPNPPVTYYTKCEGKKLELFSYLNLAPLYQQ